MLLQLICILILSWETLGLTLTTVCRPRRQQVHHGITACAPRFALPLASSASKIPHKNLVDLREPTIQSDRVQFLSTDPLVYVIPNFLTPQECHLFRNRILQLENAPSTSSSRKMTRSNPPDVSINIAKLWPLPLLSLVAGIPPVLRLVQVPRGEGVTLSLSDYLHAALPSIAVALTFSLALAFGIVLPLIRTISNASGRTSAALALNQLEDMEFIRPLVDRVSQTTGHPWTNWEAPVVTRYDAGAVFRRHGDASPTKGSEWSDLGGQRIVTCICYLNNVGEGGETYFDQLKLSVQPEAGKALVFFPADSITCEADDRTTHESLPPKEEKWIVQMFGRSQRVPPPLGLPNEFTEVSVQ